MADIAPTPQPAPSPAPAKWYDKIDLFKIFMVVVMSLMGYTMYDMKTNGTANYTVAVDPEAVKLGQAYLPLHNDAYYQSVEAEVQDILAGKSIEEAQAHRAQVEQSLRAKAYTDLVGNKIFNIIPAGTTTLTSDQKDHLASFLRGTAKPFKKR
jgi:hypothetical protein